MKKPIIKFEYKTFTLGSEITHEQKDYFNKYYQTNLAIKVQCDHCGELISKSKINQHMKTNKCINALDELKIKCLICSKHIFESRQKQHERSSYCKSFLN